MFRRVRRLGVAGAVMGSALLSAAACLDDTPVTVEAPTVRAMLSANVVGAMAGGTVRIRVAYRTRSQQLVALPATPERITVAPGSTVMVPITVDIGPCLSDPARTPEGEPGCALAIELTLSDAEGSVIDSQTRDATGTPATPGQAVNFGTITIGIQVAAIVVAPTSLGMNVSQEQQLTATVHDAAGAVVTTIPVTWTTSDASVAQLSTSSGAAITVRALKLGSATVTASAGGKSSSPVAVSVVPPPPLTIRQRPAAGCVLVGQTVTLDVDSPPGPVTWSVSSASVATIGASSGVVTGVASGQATVTATSGNRTGTASVCVAGPLSVAPASLSITAGRTAQLTATNAVGATVSFASGATGIATVDATGLVRGVGIGQTTITTTLTGGSGTQTATTPVTVTAASIAITPTNASVPLGRSARFTAKVLDANGAALPGVPVAWSISDASVGSLSATSADAVDARSLKVGTATVRASAGGASASAEFTVTQALPAARLEKASGDETTCPTFSFACTFVARAVDANGFPVAGASVAWSTSYGCASGPVTTTDQDGLTSASNLCSQVPPGTYTQTATLIPIQQQVTFSYTLRGLTLTVGTTFFDSITVSITSSTGPATGLDVAIRYGQAPATNYVTGLQLDRTTTPAELTFGLDYYSLPYGDYSFEVVVTTTTPGIGPGVEAFSFSIDESYFRQPNVGRTGSGGTRPTVAALPRP